MIGCAIALVNFAVSSQVGDNGEMTAAAISFTGIGFLARVAVHVCLKRAWASEALVADLALVLLLCR